METHNITLYIFNNAYKTKQKEKTGFNLLNRYKPKHV